MLGKRKEMQLSINTKLENTIILILPAVSTHWTITVSFLNKLQTHVVQ